MVLQAVRGGVFDHDSEIAAFGVLAHLARQAADVAHAVALAAHEQFLESLAESSKVHVEDSDVGVGIVVLQVLGFFDGVHAADIGAVGVSSRGIEGARANALHKADAPGALQVAGPSEMAVERTPGGDQSLELHAGYDIGEAGVAVFVERGGIVHVHAGGDDDCAHLDVEELVPHIKIDAALLAGLYALAASNRVLTKALVGHDDVG